MTGLQTLVARTALGAVFAAAGIALASSKRPHELSKESFTRVFTWAFVAVRLGLYVLIFFVLHLAARGDVPSFYVTQGDLALKHLVVYRDFPSSYAPLHPYLDALILRVWHSPLAIILMAICVEILSAPLWLALGRRFASERVVRIAAILFLTSPISIQFVTVDGQNNVLIAALIALSLWMMLKGKEFLSGAVLAASIALVKFLPLLYAPAYLFCSPRKWRLVLGGTAVLAAIYGTFVLLHAPILMPFTQEGGLKGAANLGYVLEAVTGITFPNIVLDGTLLTVILIVLGLIANSVRGLGTVSRVRVLMYGVAALTLVLLVLSKKSWPPYLVLALFPMCLSVAESGSKRLGLRLLIFALLQVVFVSEHSVWETLLHELRSIALHQAIMVGQIPLILFFLLQLSVVAGYFWLMYESLRKVITAQQWVGDGTEA